MADHAVIGYVRGKDVAGEFCESLVSVAMEATTHLDAVLRYVSGPNISTPRNLVVDEFLRSYKAPWLLMVDTDMVFSGSALDRLIAAAHPVERPVVGALCFSPAAGEVRPTMYEITEKEPGVLGFAHRLTWPEDTCVQVSATGTGFLLMHRAALEKVAASSRNAAAPWFQETPVGSPLTLMGEDMTFCLRAGAAGIPIFVHTGVQVGHMKPEMLGKVC